MAFIFLLHWIQIFKRRLVHVWTLSYAARHAMRSQSWFYLEQGPTVLSRHVKEQSGNKHIAGVKVLHINVVSRDWIVSVREWLVFSLWVIVIKLFCCAYYLKYWDQILKTRLLVFTFNSQWGIDSCMVFKFCSWHDLWRLMLQYHKRFIYSVSFTLFEVWKCNS